MLEKIKSNSSSITMVLLLLVILRQCGVNRDIDRIEKNIKNTNLVIDTINKKTPSKKEIREEMNQTMFNFLIYEDDFDKGRTSLSEIKSKINETK